MAINTTRTYVFLLEIGCSLELQNLVPLPPVLWPWLCYTMLTLGYVFPGTKNLRPTQCYLGLSETQSSYVPTLLLQ